MEFKVQGRLTGVVLIFRGDKRNLFEELKLKGVEKACFELNNANCLFLYGSNIHLVCDDMFDDGCDAWHGSIEISCDVTLPIQATSEKQAIEFATMFHSKYFFEERVQLFTKRDNVMIEFEIEGSTIHYTGTKKELHRGVYAI